MRPKPVLILALIVVGAAFTPMPPEAPATEPTR